jgi:hypothetical protein
MDTSFYQKYKDQFVPPNIIRLCANCDREQHLDQQNLVDHGWGLSHGICKRHQIQMYKTAGFDDQRIKDIFAKREKTRTQVSCLDLSDSNNKDFLDWLKNPSQAPTN